MSHLDEAQLEIALRDTLLPKLLSGELDVSEDDPSFDNDATFERVPNG